MFLHQHVSKRWARRNLLQFAALAVSAPAWPLAAAHPTAGLSIADVTDKPVLGDEFPTQSPQLVLEMVRVSHFDLKRVQQLVDAHPSLARAAWDWGFGDWETALGAASHMGNRPIAEYLVSRGAPPSLFSAAMLGQLEMVKAFAGVQLGIQRIRGPHSISLLAHAQAGGEAAQKVYEFIRSLGDAEGDTSAPLSPADLESMVGEYPFGAAPNDCIEVSANKNNLTWTRRGTMGRPLFHLGERVFYPSGAPAVRIRFTQQGSETKMTIHDPDVVLTALRRK